MLQSIRRGRNDPKPKLKTTLLGALAGAGAGYMTDEQGRAGVVDAAKRLTGPDTAIGNMTNTERGAGAGALLAGGGGLLYNQFRDPERRLNLAQLAGLTAGGAGAGALAGANAPQLQEFAQQARGKIEDRLESARTQGDQPQRKPLRLPGTPVPGVEYSADELQQVLSTPQQVQVQPDTLAALNRLRQSNPDAPLHDLLATAASQTGDASVLNTVAYPVARFESGELTTDVAPQTGLRRHMGKQTQPVRADLNLNEQNGVLRVDWAPSPRESWNNDIGWNDYAATGASLGTGALLSRAWAGKARELGQDVNRARSAANAASDARAAWQPFVGSARDPDAFVAGLRRAADQYQAGGGLSPVESVLPSAAVPSSSPLSAAAVQDQIQTIADTELARRGGQPLSQGRAAAQLRNDAVRLQQVNQDLTRWDELQQLRAQNSNRLIGQDASDYARLKRKVLDLTAEKNKLTQSIARRVSTVDTGTRQIAEQLATTAGRGARANRALRIAQIKRGLLRGVRGIATAGGVAVPHVVNQAYRNNEQSNRQFQ